MEEEVLSQIGYCGLYCLACGIYQGKVKQAVVNLRKVIKAYGFDKIPAELSKWEPAFHHYREFEEVLSGFERLFQDCPGCRRNGGDAGCVMRECCKQKSLVLCANCIEMQSCHELARMAKALEESQTIKLFGAEKWVEEMQKKVSNGYCYLQI